MAQHITPSHLFMRVADLARTRTFYVDVLELDLLMDHGSYIRVGGPGGFHIGIEQGGPPDVGGRGIEINLRVDDVDQRYAELRERGVVFGAPPTAQPWGARHAWFTDPDGYRLSIFSPTE